MAPFVGTAEELDELTRYLQDLNPKPMARRFDESAAGPLAQSQGAGGVR